MIENGDCRFERRIVDCGATENPQYAVSIANRPSQSSIVNRNRQSSICQIRNHQSPVGNRLICLSDSPLPARAGRPGGAGDHSSDPAGAEERRAVPVADVPAADSVSVGAAAADPQLAAAAAAAGGAGADRRGVRAAVPAARGAAAAAAGGAREVVVLVDRSYSMGYGDRWTRATRRRATRSARVGPADRASVVFFASGAEVALRSTPDRSRLNAAVATGKPGAGATRYGPALKLAGSIASESALPHREVILISDFQRAGWQGAEGVRLPDGVTLTPVRSVADGETANVSVTPVSLQRSTFSEQDRVTVTGGVTNHGRRGGLERRDHARGRRPRRSRPSTSTVEPATARRR